MKSVIRKASILIVIALLCPLTAFAQAPYYVPYDGYEYNSHNETVSAPVGYTLLSFHDSESMALEIPLDNIQDICFEGESVFILDSGNSRILETDKNFKLKAVYGKLTTDEGEELSFSEAKGFTVDKNGTFYIADTGNTRVIIAKKDCTVTNIITRPEEALNSVDFPFRASKVKVNSRGEIYVVAESINLGIFVFSSDGKFKKFVGSNPVYKTGEVIAAFFFRRFQSKEQIRNSMQHTPLQVADFCLDSMDYVYTVSYNQDSVLQTGMVRRLNYYGDNVLDIKRPLGDTDIGKQANIFTRFIAVDVDKDGNLFLLDSGRGKVFVYSKQGFLVTVFGGFGDQRGLFGMPSEIAVDDGKIYVLDQTKNTIYEFAPTNYVAAVKQALLTLENNELENSLKLWSKVLSQNTNSRYPYYGLGLVYDAMGDYTQAMEHFKLAGAREEYSNSFREYRKAWVEGHYFLIFGSLIFLIAAAVLYGRVKKRLFATKVSGYSGLEKKWTFPLFVLMHPIDGFDQIKSRKLTSVRLSAGIVTLWFLASSASFLATGFAFNANRASDFNPLSTLLATAGIFALFVIANWCLCTLFEGKGKVKEILSATAYSLLPYIFSILLCILLSNVLTEQEAVFITLINIIGVLWTAVLLIGSLYSIHEYSVSKTVLSIIATVVGMLIISFLAILFFTLLQQAFNFIYSVWTEASLR